MESQLFLPDKIGSIKSECNKSLWLENPLTPDLILKKIYSSRTNKPLEDGDDFSFSAYTDTEFHGEAMNMLIHYSKLLKMNELRNTVDSSSEVWCQAFLYLSKNLTSETHQLLKPITPLPFSNTETMSQFLHKVKTHFLLNYQRIQPHILFHRME